MLDNLQIPNEAITETVKSVDRHIGATYDNMTTSPSRAFGQGVADVIELIFSPIHHLSEKSKLYYKAKLDLYRAEISEKINSIPAEKQTEANFHTVAIAIENSKYCITNDDLRRMFVNLIGNSINSDMNGIIHPSFSAIIKELSSLDAQIMRLAYHERIHPAARFAKTKTLSSHTFYAEKYDVVITEPDMIKKQSASIANLERLNLIRYHIGNNVFPVAEYDELVELYKESFEAENTILQEGYIEITDYGLHFMKACCE